MSIQPRQQADFDYFFYGIRASNTTPHSSLEKTKMCALVLMGTRCPKDTNCTYAHHPDELRQKQVVPNFKTLLCTEIHSNMTCKFRHSNDIVTHDSVSKTIIISMRCPFGNGAPVVYMKGYYT